MSPHRNRREFLVRCSQRLLSDLVLLDFLQKITNLIVFLSDYLILFLYLFALEEDLPLADISELLSQYLALKHAVLKDQIDHAHVRVKDRLKEDASLNTLH